MTRVMLVLAWVVGVACDEPPPKGEVLILHKPKAKPTEPKVPPPDLGGAELALSDDEPAPDSDAARHVARMEELAALHRQHNSDCISLANALEGFAAKHAQVLHADQAGLAQEIAAHDDLRVRLRAALKQVMTTSMACTNDRIFVKTYEKLARDAAD